MRPISLLFVIAIAVACKSEERAKRPRVGRTMSTAEEAAMSTRGTSSEAPPPPPKVTLSELVEGGRHVRLATAHGPVHVWTPKGYDRKRAETILYVHGYFVHVDQAWSSYKLETQFASSAINAIFIACEAPNSTSEPISWTSLADLLDTVEKGIGEKLPRRRIVAMGHSGAHRTLRAWLSDPAIDTVVLVDAAYGEIDEYKDWILGDPHRRLIDVGDDTRAWTDKLHADLPETVVLEEFPTLAEGIPQGARRARILYIKSSLGHMPLVTSGYSIPMILRMLRARRVVREPLAELLERP
jgi:hypothetical protein